MYFKVRKSRINLVFDFYFILAENNFWQGRCLTVFIVLAFTGDLKDREYMIEIREDCSW